MDTIIRLNFANGNNSIKNVSGILFFFFLTHCLMMLKICTRSHEKISKGFKLLSGSVSKKSISKGHNCIKNVGGVTFLFSANCLMML